MLYVVCCPTSSGWEPEAVKRAATLHVGKGGGGLVTGDRIQALSTCMSAGTMSPTVVARSRGTSTTRGCRSVAIVSATAITTTTSGVGVAHSSHHFLPLGEECSFAGNKIGLAKSGGSIGLVRDRVSRSFIWKGFVGSSFKETLGDEVGDVDCRV
jgi:hypothetical protein